MDNITANTLFHFTGKEALLSILKTGFRPSYSSEMGVSLSVDAPEILVPIICFCDLPISKVERHIHGYDWEHNNSKRSSKKYGQYGLGMTKDWGMRKGLNPVTYITGESQVLDFLHNIDKELRWLCNELQKKWDSSNVDPVIKNYYDNPVARAMSWGSPPMPIEYNTLMSAANALSNSAAFAGSVKPYMDNETGQLYYNEREWRYVIPYTRNYDGSVPFFFKKDDKLMPTGQHVYAEIDMSKLEYYKKNIADRYMLKFEPNDIKYIIVQDDSDIHDTINYLRTLPTVYDEIAIEKLMTKLITCQQIKEDF